jgi:hypothetical protein
MGQANKITVRTARVKHSPLGWHQHRYKHDTEMNQNKVGLEAVDWATGT